MAALVAFLILAAAIAAVVYARMRQLRDASRDGER